MKRYNIALLLLDAGMNARLVELAQQYFGDIHNGYVLGSEALPHVTLCQFHAPDESAAIAAYESFTEKAMLALDIYKFHIRPGKRINSGSFIAEYKITPSAQLIAMQRNCHDYLCNLGLEVLTPAADYSPHFTLARLPHQVDEMPGLADLPYLEHIKLRPAVGLSTDPGAFVREISPQD